MASDPAQPSSASPATVLVVDDNKDAVDIITRLLVQKGLIPLCAYSGQECLDIVRNQPVDVIILDVMMPGMDGLEVCRQLKNIVPTLPVILLTAKDDMATRTAGMSLGVSEFVVKPVNHRDLLDRVQTQLSTRQWEREIDQASATIDLAKKKEGDEL
ncbi:MAG: two-component system response regulator [Candidatus Binatia bacterium]